MRIGIDFDNTIALYDTLFLTLAQEKGWLPPTLPTPHSKRQLRDHLRHLPEGEQKWQLLQAIAYGPRLEEAIPAPGVKNFFLHCQQREIPLFIISHKSRFAAAAPDGMDLRQAAITWLHRENFFPQLALHPEHLIFTDNRSEKIQAIRFYRCTHFIDDLEELLLDPDFPPETHPCLFAPGQEVTSPTLLTFRSWQALHDTLLGR